VSHVRNVLIVLICLSPVTLLWDSLITQSLLAGLVAVTLTIATITLQSGETQFLVFVSRSFLVAVAIPALWVILQILPLHSLAHPIWRSAETALQEPLSGSISVDPGASIIALGRYLDLVALAFLTAAVSLDRLRAEWALYALNAASSAIAFLVLVNVSVFRGDWLVSAMFEAGIDCAGLGIVFAGAACVRSYERYETRRAQRSPVKLVASLTIFSTAFVICCTALVLAGTMPAILAAAFGFGVLVCIVIIRRFGLGMFGIGGVAVLGIGIAIVVTAFEPNKRGVSVTLAFSPESSPATALSQRMLDDAPALGTGAGTFVVLAPIYREKGDPLSSSAASTAAGTLAIELGTPMMWLITAAIAAGIFMFLWASLQRGRDSFYPAMAGAALTTLLLLSFTNAGVLGNATGLIAAAAVGLGLAQSKGRSAQF
jgi:hypothetical protein